MIPFNKPYMTGGELRYIEEAHLGAKLSGDGPFTKRCHALLEQTTGASKALLTHSCTAALEMSALICDIKPGDEVIMPSYTFVSTANAFALRGGVPVFVDVRRDTLNLDEGLIEAAITDRTRAIVPVHYAGVACAMDPINAIAARHGLDVVEDAAQGVGSRYKGKALGTLGRFGALSFHETKNVICGEGGALLITALKDRDSAEVIREKGTDRSLFVRGVVDKYTWRSIGSSYLPGEVTAAFLLAQLEHADWLTNQRLAVWSMYHERFASLESDGLITRPVVPDECQHNAHMYYILVESEAVRRSLLADLSSRGIGAVFHYVPLHSSPGGLRYGRSSGALDVTDDIASRIVRLPLWVGLAQTEVDQVVAAVGRALRRRVDPVNSAQA